MPMTGPERRQTPRTTLDTHAYINIEPNNGGIVLNVSDGGLCVHSFDPVPGNGKGRFGFSDNGQRIEADGKLAWMDETQKGGLRFVGLSADARKKIGEWMARPNIPLAADERSPSVGQRRPTFPIVPAPDTKAVSASPASLAKVSPELRVLTPLSGFSRGLATGLAVSAVLAAALLFNNYRREFGESLIRLGERFAAKPEAQTITVSAASPAVLPPVESARSQQTSPAPRMTSPAKQAALPAPRGVSPAPATSSAARTEKVLAQPKTLLPQPLATPAKSQPTQLESATSVSAAPVAARDIGTSTSTDPETAAAAPPSSPTAPPVSLPATAPAIDSSTAGAPGSNPGKPGTAPKLELVNQPGIHTESSGAVNADSSRELYFEVGKFKNVFQAHDESDKLAHLGFPVTAVQKGFLWSNSIHVLVGPYGDEEQ